MSDYAQGARTLPRPMIVPDYARGLRTLPAICPCCDRPIIPR